jgi:hypothetical protein
MTSTRQIHLTRRLVRQLLAGSCGAIICGFLFGLLGDISQQRILGVFVGVIIGAFLGCGLLSGYVGSFSMWTIGFAILGAFIGPGCDFYGPSPAIIGAALGAYFWLLKWHGLFMLVGGLAGLNLGATLDRGGSLGTLGMFVGVLTGLALGRLLLPTSLKRRNTQSSSGVDGSSIHG